MDQTPIRRGRYKPPTENELSRLQALAGAVEMPKPYSEQLAEFCAEYRRTDQLPRTDYAKLTAAPKDQFRMFPAKCRRSLDYASGDAKLVFHALWGQHEDRHARANGLLMASTDWLMTKTEIYNRNDISDAVLELEVLGLVRVQRGRGGRGVSLPNMFLLTAFPDCLGNAPVADYERHGLPETKSKANDPDTVALEERDIAQRFKARIKAQMEVVRYTRNLEKKRRN